jgi:hypothetical protein
LKKIREAHEKFGHSLFFNPHDIPYRLYTKEVLGLLQFFVHPGVPKKAVSGCPEIQPSTVKVTGRSFQKIIWKSLKKTTVKHSGRNITIQWKVCM